MWKPPTPVIDKPPGDNQYKDPALLRLIGLSMNVPAGLLTPTKVFLNPSVRNRTASMFPRVSNSLNRWKRLRPAPVPPLIWQIPAEHPEEEPLTRLPRFCWPPAATTSARAGGATSASKPVKRRPLNPSPASPRRTNRRRVVLLASRTTRRGEAWLVRFSNDLLRHHLKH